MLRVTIWNEFRHEITNDAVKAIYPDGIHMTIARHLDTQANITTKTAVLDDSEHGLTDEVLNETDVLVWWGHAFHDEVDDEIVKRVQQRVLDGMGLLVLHSGHHSKIFKTLMGTTCNLRWRVDDEKERIWVIEPSHPIAAGLPPYIEIEKEEMYGEQFDVPAPDSLVFVSWFEGGEVFRSGCCYQRGAGKIFYFRRPGHETFPTYHNPQILQIITNAVNWLQPTAGPGNMSKVIHATERMQ